MGVLGLPARGIHVVRLEIIQLHGLHIIKRGVGVGVGLGGGGGRGVRWREGLLGCVIHRV